MSNVIAVGDYVNKTDQVERVPVNDGNTVLVRIMYPTPEDELIIVELVQLGVSDGLFKGKEEVDELDFEKLETDDKVKLIRFGYVYTSTLISSCCYHPTMNTDGTVADVQEENPRKVWKDADDVMQNCKTPLYHALKKFLSDEGVAGAISAGEAKK